MKTFLVRTHVDRDELAYSDAIVTHGDEGASVFDLTASNVLVNKALANRGYTEEDVVSVIPVPSFDEYRPRSVDYWITVRDKSNVAEKFHDVVTHELAWRSIIVSAIQSSKSNLETGRGHNPEYDNDYHYLNHELRVFDRLFGALKKHFNLGATK